MDTTDVIMELMATLNRLQITRVGTFQEYLILRMGVRWYAAKTNKEASTLTS